MAYIRYRVYVWVPPKLTTEQEQQIAREIARVGREQFLHLAPYLDDDGRRRSNTFSERTPRQKAVLIALAAAFFIPILIFFWLPILVVGVPVFIYSGGSFLHARRTYRRWVNDIATKYGVK